MFSAQLLGDCSSSPLAADATQIWSAGVQRVLPAHIVPVSIKKTEHGLSIAGREFLSREFDHVYVFGAGKAGAAMAAAVEAALFGTPYWASLRGRVNVPGSESLFTTGTRKIDLQVARPAGSNFPTVEGMLATRRMIDDLAALDHRTIALGLISGGGSALMIQPREGVSFDQLLAVTRFLHAAGATIHELNAVRSWLSVEKAGGLARLCTATRIETLIISDVVGDDLGVIASGLCHPSDVTARQAHSWLQQSIDAAKGVVPQEVIAALAFLGQLADENAMHPLVGEHVRNNLIATNETALTAAKLQAEALEYTVVSQGSTNQGDAYAGGRAFAQQCAELRERGGRWCILSGGEPTLVLKPNRPAGCKGGRNQAWALAALAGLADGGHQQLHDIAILAGGTDGEDGPCDMAGACVSQEVLEAARRQQLDWNAIMQNNNEYAFFSNAGGHLTTAGGTNTNVADLRVACIEGVN